VKPGMINAPTLDQVLSGMGREGVLFERLPGRRLRSYACGHRYRIPPARSGIGKVRWNEDGRLRANRSGQPKRAVGMVGLPALRSQLFMEPPKG
jgi:hypothetical protein